MGPKITFSSGHLSWMFPGCTWDVSCMCASVVVGPATISLLVGGVAPSPSGYEALPCSVAAGELKGGAGSLCIIH